jgi:YD repeat-containing protein
VCVLNAAGFCTIPAFNPAQQPGCVTDANGHCTTVCYDPRCLECGTQTPLGTITTFQRCDVPIVSGNHKRDPGNLSQRTTADNRTTTYTLDGLNRTVGQSYPDGTRVTHSFDLAGRHQSMGDVTGVTSYIWTPVSLPASLVYPTGKTLTYGYDLVYNRTSTQD